MIKLNHNGKKHFIPSNCDELTLGEYIALQNLNKTGEWDVERIISALSGIPYEAVKGAIIDDVELDIIMGHISTLIKDIGLLPSLNSSGLIEVSGKAVKPKAWKLQTVAARINYYQKIHVEGVSMDEYLIDMLALVVAPELYGMDRDWETSLYP